MGESSVLIVGTSPEEVTFCTSALLTLLQPYKWSNVFMPLIPFDYLDLVQSPVPFIAGTVAEDNFMLDRILNDDRIVDAASNGLRVLNLNTGQIIISVSNRVEKQRILTFSQAHMIEQRVANYQKRLKLLSEEKTSALLHFNQFFQQGTSTREGLTIQSLKQVIRDNFISLFRLNYDDEKQWEKFSDFDEVTQSYTFYPSKLTMFLKYQCKFLTEMIQTQLFLESLPRKIESACVKLDNPAALFIADWLFFRWKYVRGTLPGKKEVRPAPQLDFWL